MNGLGPINRTSIHTAKYADDIILLAKEETTGHVWQASWSWMTLQNGNECVNDSMKISKQPPPSPHTDYKRSKATGKWGMFHLAW